MSVTDGSVEVASSDPVPPAFTNSKSAYSRIAATALLRRAISSRIDRDRITPIAWLRIAPAASSANPATCAS